MDSIGLKTQRCPRCEQQYRLAYWKLLVAFQRAVLEFWYATALCDGYNATRAFWTTRAGHSLLSPLTIARRLTSLSRTLRLEGFQRLKEWPTRQHNHRSRCYGTTPCDARVTRIESTSGIPEAGTSWSRTSVSKNLKPCRCRTYVRSLLQNPPSVVPYVPHAFRKDTENEDMGSDPHSTNSQSVKNKEWLPDWVANIKGDLQIHSVWSDGSAMPTGQPSCGS